MLIPLLVVTGGVAYVGTKFFTKPRKMQTRAFLLTSAKAAAVQRRFSPATAVSYGIESVRNKLRVPLYTLTRQLFPSHAGAIHQQQLQEIGNANVSEQVHKFRDLDQKMMIATVSLGLATAGALLYPPLSLLSLPGSLYVYWYFFKSAYTSVFKEHRPNVDVLVACVTIFCIIHGYIFAWSLQVWLGMYGRRLTDRIRDTSQNNVIDVFRQHPKQVLVLVEGREVEVSFETVHEGDTVVVEAGGIIPVDGQITQGLAGIDQRILTGEAQPVDKESGDTVYALTVVLSGKLYIHVTKAGQETIVAQIGEILSQTVNFKTHGQLRVEAAGNRAVVPMLLTSVLFTPFIGLANAFAFLNSHPRYKTNIATYLGIFRFLGQASQQGVLIKDGKVLELLNEVDTIVFDKTGTLTQEQPHIGQIHACLGYTEESVLTLMASAEARQVHPIAKAIRQEAMRRKLPLFEIEEAVYTMGYGLRVTIDGQHIQVGSRRFIEQEGIEIPESLQQLQEFCYEQGHSFIMMAVERRVAGAIELHTTVRPEVQTMIRGLRQRHLSSLYIISGDHERPTQQLADMLGIDNYFAETLPENKSELIRQLQQAGKTVCYVGDGINDAIALKQADVSISLRGASTVATDTAQVILMDGNLHQLCFLFDLAKAFENSMRTTMRLILLPVLLSAGGAVLFQIGFLPSVLLPQIGLMLGITNVMRSGRLDLIT